MLNSDRISTWMGAPPNHWKDSETKQMKRIHTAYKRSYGLDMGDADVDSVTSEEEAPRKNKYGVRVKTRELQNPEETENTKEIEEQLIHEGTAKDEENYLPIDSPLRSKDGDMRMPANATFKDYNAFLNSLSFDYWKRHFENGQGDKFLVEIARSIMSKICTAQSRNQLRAHNGHVPFRKKREHITPLALVLHELKSWLITELRSANPANEETFKEIKKRLEYVRQLAHKEIWGNYTSAFGQGIRVAGQDKLFRIFQAATEQLQKAQDYAFRAYSRRSSREKLESLSNTLKDLIMNEMRVLSGRMDFEHLLSDPKTARLQPLDYLNEIENMQYIDFKNPANVLLFKICRNPFVQACLTADFENDEVLDIVQQLGSWSEQNYFCRQGAGEPIILRDKSRARRFLPEVYHTTQGELKLLIRQVDGRTPVPDDGKKIITRVKKLLESDEAVENVFLLLIKALAALQDMMPTIYAVYKLWSLAGDGGDFTVFDTMRTQVIKVMEDGQKRISTLKKASSALNKYMRKLCVKKEEELKKEAMKSGKMVYKPNWVNNQTFIATDMSKASKKSYGKAFNKLMELAKDARDYTLTADQLSDKVRDAQKILSAIVGAEEIGVGAVVDEEDDIEATFVPINVKKKDKDRYVDNTAPVEAESDDDDDMMFGANNNYNDKSSGNSRRKNKKAPVAAGYDSDDSY